MKAQGNTLSCCGSASTCGAFRSMAMVTLASLAVHAFVQPDTAQAQCDPEEVAKLVPADAAQGDRFGNSVSMNADGTIAIVGARWDDDFGENSGAAYIFTFDGSQWIEDAKLVPADGEERDGFGNSCSLSKDGMIAVVGSPQDDDNGLDSGSAYIFRFNGSEWVEEAKLLASDGEENDRYGYSVAVSGDGSTAIVGARWDDDNGLDAGSAYVYRYNGSEWGEEAKLLASDGAADDRFGEAVTINFDGRRLLVGAPQNDDLGEDSGSAYNYRFDGTEWIEREKILPTDGVEDDEFGFALSMNDEGDAAIISAHQADDRGFQSGAAYIFRSQWWGWFEDAKLLAPDGKAYDDFGWSVALSSDANTAVVAAWLDDNNGLNSGSAYIFRFTGAEWEPQARILASDGARDDNFGSAVAISGDGLRAMTGANGDTIDDNRSGSVYVYQLNCFEPCIRLTVEYLVAGGRAQITISNGTPGVRAVTVGGVRPGTTTIRGREDYCATFGIRDVDRSKVIGRLDRTFDDEGMIRFSIRVPVNAAGERVLLQAAEQGTCPDECISNLIFATVQ